MSDLIFQIGLPILTAVLGVWSGKYLTKREKRKDDLKIVEETTSGLVNSVTILSDEIQKVTEEWKKERQENLEYREKLKFMEIEKIELKGQIENLTREVDMLKKTIDGLVTELQKHKQKNIIKENPKE